MSHGICVSLNGKSHGGVKKHFVHEIHFWKMERLKSKHVRVTCCPLFRTERLKRKQHVTHVLWTCCLASYLLFKQNDWKGNNMLHMFVRSCSRDELFPFQQVIRVHEIDSISELPFHFPS
ncbi:hypothetical protein CEXT_419581 [Caerostris extrusa]|uniref:Uncharacterized protein n=1 Tax=Caerostris extrusa TaxID=172846 RepID=A0AAV4QEZ7_CAEEX|nr:hypothetical protein CEXT_419581 [Caerostris extrusa]